MVAFDTKCECPQEGPIEDIRRVLMDSDTVATALDAMTSTSAECWLYGGSLRDAVLSVTHPNGAARGDEEPDLDIAFFDPDDLSTEGEQELRNELRARVCLDWEVRNQAARIHGHARPRSVHDALTCVPETLTCVAVTNGPSGLLLCAPLGVADLLAGIWRFNGICASKHLYDQRLREKNPLERWPGVVLAS